MDVLVRLRRARVSGRSSPPDDVVRLTAQALPGGELVARIKSDSETIENLKIELAKGARLRPQLAAG